MAKIKSIQIYNGSTWVSYSLQQLISQEPIISSGVNYPLTINSDATAFVRIPETVATVPTYILNVNKSTTSQSTKWDTLHEQYAFTISSGVLGFSKPYIDKVIVYNDQGYGEETWLRLYEFIDGRVRIYSETDINCKIIIKGE